MCRWYLISGKGRITAFAGSSAARTFDVQPGDSGVIPTKCVLQRSAGLTRHSYGHYVQNVGNESLTILEVFKAKRFQCAAVDTGHRADAGQGLQPDPVARAHAHTSRRRHVEHLDGARPDALQRKAGTRCDVARPCSCLQVILPAVSSS